MVLGRVRNWLIATFLGTDRRILVLALARMADSFGNSFLIIVLPVYIASGSVDIQPVLGVTVPVLGISLTETLLIGIVLSLFGLLNSSLQPLTGKLSDQMGRRTVFIVFGLVLLGAASTAYAFVETYALIVLLRAIQGIGAAFTIPMTVALINDLGEGTHRGGNFGVFNTFRLLGFGFGPVVAGVIIGAGPYQLGGLTLSGFDATFFLAGFAAAVSIVLVTLLVSDPDDLDAAAAEDLSIAILDPTGRRLLDPVFAVGIATFFMATGLALFAPLESQINRRLGQGSTLFAIEFAAAVIANVVFQVAIGQASDRYGRRPFIIAGFVLLAPAVLAQGIVTEPLLMIAVRFLQGVAIALVFAPGLALAGDMAGESGSGTRLSVLTTAFGFGVALGPLSAGFLVGFGFRVPFVFGAALGLLGLVIVYTQVGETVTDSASITGEVAPQDD